MHFGNVQTRVSVVDDREDEELIKKRMRRKEALLKFTMLTVPIIVILYWTII